MIRERIVYFEKIWRFDSCSM